MNIQILDRNSIISEQKYPRIDRNHESIEIFRNCTLKKNKKDQWFFTKDKKLMKYEGFIEKEDCIMLRGRTVENKKDFYTLPLKSSMLDIYQSDGKIDTEEKHIEIEHFFVKLFQIPCKEDGQFVFSPIRHTYNL